MAPVKRTGECLKISERTVKRVTSTARRSWGKLESPRKENKGIPKITLDEYLKGIIGCKTHQYYIEKDYPTAEKVHKYLEENVPDFQKISRSSLPNK